MYIHDPKNSKDIVICMRRDEFIRLVSEGIECLKETNPRAGLPYFADDSSKDVRYYNFSILDAADYSDTFSKAIKQKASPSPGMYMTSDFLDNWCWACRKCRGLGVCYCKSEKGEDICSCGWLKSECKCQKKKMKSSVF